MIKDNSQLPLQVQWQESFCLCISSMIITFRITTFLHLGMSQTPKHWSNEHTMKEYVTNIILPYDNGKRRALKLAREQPALLLFDNFKAQCTSSFLTLLDANNISVVMISPNCTDRLHPLDLSVNKAGNDFLHGQFREWYAKQVCSQMDGNNAVDLRLSVLKPLGAAWIDSMHIINISQITQPLS